MTFWNKYIYSLCYSTINASQPIQKYSNVTLQYNIYTVRHKIIWLKSLKIELTVLWICHTHVTYTYMKGLLIIFLKLQNIKI